MKRPLQELSDELVQALDACTLASPGRQFAARKRLAIVCWENLGERLDAALLRLDRTFTDHEAITTDAWIALLDKYVAGMKVFMAAATTLQELA
jgi:hypothetical protein